MYICIKAQNIKQHVLPCCFAQQGSCVLQWQQRSQARVGMTMQVSAIKARKQSPGWSEAKPEDRSASLLIKIKMKQQMFCSTH